MTEFGGDGLKPKIPRGKAYQDRFRDLSAGKTAIVRDETGNPQWEIFEVAKRVEQEFMQFNSFIGVSVRGSKMRGYSKQSIFKPSDIDMYVLFDPLISPEEEPEIGEKIKNLNSSFLSRLVKLGEAPLSLTSQIVPSGERDELLSFLAMPRQGEQLTQQQMTFGRTRALIEGISVLCEHMRGPRVKEYRAKLRSAIAKLPKPERTMLLARLVVIQRIHEQERFERMKERMPRAFPGVAESNEFFDARSKVWQARIRRLFFPSESDATED